MSAEAISVFPLVRPPFDNISLGNEGMWIFDNAETLARYWIDQSNVMGQAPTENMQDFDTWLKVQHDIEMAMRGPINRLPHSWSL